MQEETNKPQEEQSLPSSSEPTESDKIVITERFIDVERVFRDKAPRAARWIPFFVFWYLRRIVHEKDINAFVYAHRDDDAPTFAAAVREFFGLTVEVRGLENLPTTGRQIAAANHPLGGLDGILLMDLIGKQRSDLKVIVNDLLMNLPQLHAYFIPVNKHGSNKENIALFNQTFAQENCILYFPAGLVSRKQAHGIIKDLEWQPTFIKKAIQSKRDVVPIHVGGRNSNFFYNLARLRKWLGIKGNIEMLYLVDEMYGQKGKHIPITIGKPIPYTVFDRSRNAQEWAALVQEHVYRLSEDPNAVFEVPRV